MAYTLLKAVAAAALLTISTVQTARAADLTGLTMLTEEYPPYNYLEDGKLAGMTVDMLAAILDHLGQPALIETVQVQPWARAYATTLGTPNTMLFATTRSEAREDLFAWVGPIDRTVIGLTARVDRGLEISTADDLNGLAIGAVRDDIGEAMVREAGAPEASLELTPDMEPNARKLAAGRLDAWSAETNVALAVLRSIGEDPSDYTVAYELKVGELYYAFNPDTDPAISDAFQGALDALEADGTLPAIRARYRGTS